MEDIIDYRSSCRVYGEGPRISQYIVSVDRVKPLLLLFLRRLRDATGFCVGIEAHEQDPY